MPSTPITSTSRSASRRGSSRNAGLVGAGILLSRASGLVRETAIGYFLGVGLASDAFRAALRIPNLLQNLLGEGVLSASFIPVYTRLRAEGREAEAGRVAGAVAGLLAALAGALVVAGVVFAGPLTSLLVAGFTGEKRELTVRLVRIITPGVGFLVLSAWCLGVLNSHRRFFLPYVAPVLWNAAMVTGLVGAGLLGSGATSDLAVALAWGTLAGGVAQMAVQLPSVLRSEPRLRVSLRARMPPVREVLSTASTVIAGRGVVQLLGYVDLLLASFLATGAQSSLAYAQVLYLLPIALFGASVAAAELPELVESRRDLRGVSRRIDAGLARSAFFVVPTVAAYVVLGDLLVASLLQRGEFNADDTAQVWAVLLAYTPGLVATTSSRLLQSTLYASGDARTPAVVAGLRVALGVVLGALLMLQLDQVVFTAEGLRVVGDLPSLAVPDPVLRSQEDNLHRLGAAGLALGAGMSAWLEYGLLRRTLRSRGIRTRRGGGRLRPVVSSAVIASVAALLTRLLIGELPVLVSTALCLAVLGGTYLAVARALRVPEVRSLGALAARVAGRR